MLFLFAVIRPLLLVFVALLTVGASLVVGPLNFVGLLAPNLVRIGVLARARHQLAGAVVLGGLVMVMADWVGRMLLFPSEPRRHRRDAHWWQLLYAAALGQVSAMAKSFPSKPGWGRSEVRRV